MCGIVDLLHTDDLLTAVQVILDGFDKSRVISVFEKRVRRLEECIEAKGKYAG
jgi:hypothetical protein